MTLYKYVEEIIVYFCTESRLNMIKTQFSEFETPEARRALKKLEQQIQTAVKEDKQKKAEEVLAKFEEKVGAEQLAENIKLYHGIKK